MFYKLVHNGTIIDALDANASWLKGQKHGRPILAKSREEAQGVVASDGSASFNLSGHVLNEAWLTVEAVEIDATQYAELKEQLAAGEVEDDLPGDNVTEDTTGGGNVASKAALVRRVETLEQQVQAQGEMNDMLVECILEMSEAVYAG